MADWQLDLTTTSGLRLAFLNEIDGLAVTPKLGGEATLAVGLDARDPAAGSIAVGRTAVKAYQDGVLRFNGKVVEPLDFTEDKITIIAKDPWFEFAQRRVRTVTTYTAQDAGAIATNRLSVQNGYLNTFLAAGTVQASVNRDRSYDPGKTEGEIVTQLADAAQGFFFRVDPVDNNPTVMGNLIIRYPDAGTTREEVRFEYGEETKDNLSGYHLTDTLPRNREVVASSASTGGRITGIAEDTASQEIYGLWEDEQALSDIDTTTVLTQTATAEIRPTPPRVISATPNLNAPLLFTDFNVGDFVRLRILNGTLDIFTWVRVLDGTLTVDKDGVESLSNLTIELVTGGNPATPPEQRFREEIDATRARLEALERKVETLNIGETAPASSGGGSGGVIEPTPSEPPPPPPEPPSTPLDPPAVITDSASPSWPAGVGSPQVILTGQANPKGQTTLVWFQVKNGPLISGVPTGSLVALTTQQNIGNGQNFTTYKHTVRNLARSTTYYFQAFAANDSGTSNGIWLAFTTPSRQEV